MAQDTFTDFERKVILALPTNSRDAKDLRQLRQEIYGGWLNWRRGRGQRIAISAALGRINRKRAETVGWVGRRDGGDEYLYFVRNDPLPETREAMT